MKYHTIHVDSAPKTLADQIIKQIRFGNLKPGDVLPSQRELAKQFAVSLGSIREAIKILDVLGYLHVIQGKGTYISEHAQMVQEKAPVIENALEAVSLRDLMKAREVVECHAAEMAAQNADKDSIRKLRQIKSFRWSADLGTDAYYDNDFRFHIAVAEASQNQAILEIVKMLVEKSHHHISFMNEALGIALPNNMTRCLGSANNILKYIEKKDSLRARNAMFDHLNIINKNLFRAFSGKQ